MRTQHSLMDRLPFNVQDNEQALDNALACTFPASDPVSISFHSSVTPSSRAAESGNDHLHGKPGPLLDRRSDASASSIIDAAIATMATRDLFVVAKELGSQGVELKVIARTLTKPSKRRATARRSDSILPCSTQRDEDYC